MKNLMCRILLAGSLVALAAGTAGAGVVTTWGDLTIVDSIQDVDAWLFDTAHTNPTGFPAPSSIGVNGIYPAPGPPIPANQLTVQELSSFYTSQGCPQGLALKLVISGAATTFSEIKVAIGGTDVNGGGGQLVLPPGTYGILTGLNLASFPSTDLIRVQYTAPMNSSNIVEMKFACVPEPISMVFLGTGFIGVVCARFRRKRK